MSEANIERKSMDQAAVDANPPARYLQAIKVNIWWMALFVVITVGVSFAMISRQTSVYESHVQIVLEPQASVVVSAQNTLNLLLDSDDFLGRVISENDLTHSKQELRSNIHGEGLSSNNGRMIVNIYVRGSQARAAKKLADMVAAQFILETRRFVVEQVVIGNSSENLVGTPIKNESVEPETLAEKISVLDKEIATVQEELSRIKNSEMEETAKAMYTLALTPRISLFEGLRRDALKEGLKADEQQNLTQIIAPASLPTASIYPNTRRTLLLATVAAFIFSFSIAIAREAFS